MIAANRGYDLVELEVEPKTMRQALHRDLDDEIAIVYRLPQASCQTPDRARADADNTNAVETQAFDLSHDEIRKGRGRDAERSQGFMPLNKFFHVDAIHVLLALFGHSKIFGGGILEHRL